MLKLSIKNHLREKRPYKPGPPEYEETGKVTVTITGMLNQDVAIGHELGPPEKYVITAYPGGG